MIRGDPNAIERSRWDQSGVCTAARMPEKSLGALAEVLVASGARGLSILSLSINATSSSINAAHKVAVLAVQRSSKRISEQYLLARAMHQ